MIAHHFVAARISGCHITSASALPAVPTLDDAYQIQKAMLQMPTTALGAHCGWKAGATNAGAQKTLGLEKPFRGPLFESGFVSSPASLSKNALNLNLLEPEFGFRMKADLPDPCTPEQAWAAVEEVTLVIEACGTRCRVPDATSFQRVADGGIGSHVVLGPTMNAAAAQSASLSGVEVEVSVNGNVAVTGSGYNVFEDPINSLCFLATEIGTYGHKIKKGDFVITGATCELQSL